MFQTHPIAPQVSLLMVARNTAPYIGAALQSARAQSFQDIEIVVVDDGSTDDTRAIAQSHAAEDPRVRVIEGPGAGLAAVRNASLSAARGRWAAILDSDDLLHPRHIGRLVAEARTGGAEIVAANMVSFAITGGITRTTLFAASPLWRKRRRIGLVDYIRANSAFGDPVCAGYLKPLLDMEFLRRHAIAYDPRLRIAEDYDLIARMLAHGARFSYLPRPSYFYRRHDGSTSHRQSEADLSAMLAAADTVLDAHSPEDLRTAIAHRKAGIRTLLRHTRAIAHLKARQFTAGLRTLGMDRTAWILLATSAWEGTSRRFAAKRKTRTVPAPIALVIADTCPAFPLDSQMSRQLDDLAAAGIAVVTRPVPTNDEERARLADGLPALAAILIAPPASADDAGYALMNPAITPAQPVAARAERSKWAETPCADALPTLAGSPLPVGTA